VSAFPAHISGFPVLLLLLLLLFCSSSQIRCQFGRGVHHQLLILIDFATSNLVSMYVQQQCSAFFSFFVLFFFGFLGGEFFFFFFFFFFLLHFLSFPFLGAVLLSFFLSAMKCEVSVFCESPIFFWVGGCLDFCDLRRRNSGRYCFGEEFFPWRFL
jgi:hypothetical protein